MRLFAVAATVCSIVGLSVGSATGALGGSTYPRLVKSAAALPSRAELRRLGAYALRQAEASGDAHPTEAVVVPTTTRIAREAGVAVSPRPDRPAYVIVLRGDFPDYPSQGPRISIPVGRLPRAGVLTAVVSTANAGGLDVVGDEAPDLYAMGEPEPLPLPLRPLERSY